MVKMTLDYRTSYRAIVQTDLAHQLTRQTTAWSGADIPKLEVIGTSPLGNVVLSPASTFAISSAYLLSHTAYANRLDYFSTENVEGHPFLRFDIAVNGPPLWENYVNPTYANPGGLLQWALDQQEWGTEMIAWTTYMQTNDFQGKSATLADDGGQLGIFSSDTTTSIEDFEDPTEFFSCKIFGSDFDDNFASGDLNSTLYGGLGDDTLLGHLGNDGVFGGDGNDYLLGVGGKDVMFGGNGDDRMRGGILSDIVKGGNDKDTLGGDDGNDELFGQAGDDLVNGDVGNDALFGGNDFDTMNGGTGADTLRGEAGDDFLSGGEGKDVLFGGDGDDFLRGGLGKDTLTGGAGRDTFNFNYLGDANADRIVDFVIGTDRIALTKATFPAVHAALEQQEFRLGTTALDRDDRILYDSATGRLYYDSDGSRNGAASAAPVLFATVANHAALTWQDFIVI